jgi:chromosomal replication initiator protein
MGTIQIWEKTVEAVQDKIGQQTFDRWFSPVKYLGLEGTIVTLEVPNRFYKEWIEEHYSSLLSSTLSLVCNNAITLKYKIYEEPPPPQPLIVPWQEVPKKHKSEILGVYLNKKYTFENFVVGECNRFASAASLAVADAPGKKYNPLFIYGGVGLGKTHLMQAIGNALIDRGEPVKILYMSTNQFMNEYVHAVRGGKISEFKKRNSAIDVLLIDDVQFIAGKESTQDELFHTFNTLYSMQKQIVFTSDRPPKEIGSITERLRSRFGMGLIADTEPPDIETKMAILLKKSEAEGIKLPEEVIAYLANKIKSNVRDLESCLIRLGAHASLSGRAITLEMTKQVLRDVILEDDKPLNANTIQKLVCDHFGVKVQDLKTHKKTKDIVIPRQVAMYLCKQLTDSSLSEIGKHFGGKDHSTVIHACKKVESRLQEDEDFKRKILFLEQKLKH